MTKWISPPKFVKAAGGKWCVTRCEKDKELKQQQDWFDTEELALAFYAKEKPNYE